MFSGSAAKARRAQRPAPTNAARAPRRLRCRRCSTWHHRKGPSRPRSGTRGRGAHAESPLCVLAHTLCLLLLPLSTPAAIDNKHAQVRGTPTPPISELVTVEQRPEKLKLPAGYHWYETMLVLQPLLSDEDR